MISRSVQAAALVATLLAIPAVQAVEVAGVKMEDQVKVGANELVLNGAGVRTKVFVKVYVGALFVSQKANTPAALLDAASPRRTSSSACSATASPTPPSPALAALPPPSPDVAAPPALGLVSSAKSDSFTSMTPF